MEVKTEDGKIARAALSEENKKQTLGEKEADVSAEAASKQKQRKSRSTDAFRLDFIERERVRIEPSLTDDWVGVFMSDGWDGGACSVRAAIDDAWNRNVAQSVSDGGSSVAVSASSRKDS